MCAVSFLLSEGLKGRVINHCPVIYRIDLVWERELLWAIPFALYRPRSESEDWP